jgi:hypothetical protein
MLSQEEEMTCNSGIKTTGRESSPVSLALAFAAGFLAVLTFYQAVFLLLHFGGVIPIPPFSMRPMPPFGVPEVLSQSFWGGAWGIVFLLIMPRFFSGTSYWVASAVIGGLALTLVYMFVVVPLKTGALPPNMVGLFAIGWLLNAAWGIGWAVFLKVFTRMRGES